MKNRKYHMVIGETSACTKMTMEAINPLGQRDIKRYTSDGFYSSFAPKRLAGDAIDVGDEMIVIVKTNTK